MYNSIPDFIQEFSYCMEILKVRKSFHSFFYSEFQVNFPLDGYSADIPSRFQKDKKYDQDVDKVARKILCQIRFYLALIQISKNESTVNNAKTESWPALPRDTPVRINVAEVISKVKNLFGILFKICCRPPSFQLKVKVRKLRRRARRLEKLSFSSSLNQRGKRC